MRSVLGRLKSLFTLGMPVGECKMVLIVRTDIPMTPGKAAAQCAHAAVECYRQSEGSKVHIFKHWLRIGQPKIVLRIRDERELLALAHNAKKSGLTTVLIKDAGKTQLRAGTVTVCGIGPDPNEAIDKLTSHLKVL